MVAGSSTFYGFIGGENNQWDPALYNGTTPVEPPATAEEGYHLTEDLADHAISWVRQQKALMPDKPISRVSSQPASTWSGTGQRRRRMGRGSPTTVGELHAHLIERVHTFEFARGDAIFGAAVASKILAYFAQSSRRRRRARSLS